MGPLVCEPLFQVHQDRAPAVPALCGTQGGASRAHGTEGAHPSQCGEALHREPRNQEEVHGASDQESPQVQSSELGARSGTTESCRGRSAGMAIGSHPQSKSGECPTDLCTEFPNGNHRGCPEPCGPTPGQERHPGGRELRGPDPECPSLISMADAGDASADCHTNLGIPMWCTT